jgi:hypothetical protein
LAEEGGVTEGSTVILGLTEGDVGRTEDGLIEGDFDLTEDGLIEGDFDLTEDGLIEGDFDLTDGVLDRLTDTGGVLLTTISSSSLSEVRIDGEISLPEGGRDGVLDLDGVLTLLTDAGGVLLLFFGLSFFTVFLTTISSSESSEVESNSFDLYFGGLADRLGEGDRDFCF